MSKNRLARLNEVAENPAVDPLGVQIRQLAALRAAVLGECQLADQDELGRRQAMDLDIVGVLGDETLQVPFVVAIKAALGKRFTIHCRPPWCSTGVFLGFYHHHSLQLPHCWEPLTS